jgi:hypothetical protein
MAIGRRVGAVLIWLVWLVALAAPAHADEDGFIKWLNNDGVPYQSRDSAIHFGHVVCNMVDQGYTPTRQEQMALDHGTTYTPHQVHLLIGDAVTFLCPQHMDQLDQSWDR